MIEIHQFEKGCKAISKTLGQRTIVRTIMSKWKCWPSKSSSKAIQKRSDDWSGESQKSQGQHRRNCRPLLRQLRLLFMTALSKRHWPKMASMEEWWDKNCCKPRRTLRLTETHLDDPQTIWENVLLSDWSKVELFERQVSCCIWRNPNTELHKKNITPTVKRCGGSVLVWRTWGKHEFCSPNPKVVFSLKVEA